MADFCLDCWNEMLNKNDPASTYIITKELYLCEGCAEFKPVVIALRKNYIWRRLKLIPPINFLCKFFYILWRILILPYSIYKYKKGKK